ncbi:MAG: 50S ribosomal protein L7/L12 [Candidatus Absconditabacteria bacterium]
MDLSKNVQKVFDLVKELTVIELNELVKSLEQEFGVSATPVMMAGGAAAATDAADEGEKDSFNVELVEIGQQKIAVIKVVKEVLGIGLKEAKDLVEKAPTIVKENAKTDDAESFKNKLEEAGATVKLS